MSCNAQKIDELMAKIIAKDEMIVTLKRELESESERLNAVITLKVLEFSQASAMLAVTKDYLDRSNEYIRMLEKDLIELREERERK